MSLEFKTVDDLISASDADLKAFVAGDGLVFRCPDHPGDWIDATYELKGERLARYAGFVLSERIVCETRELYCESLRGRGIYYDFYARHIVPFLSRRGVKEAAMSTQKLSTLLFFWRQGALVNRIGEITDCTQLNIGEVIALAGGTDRSDNLSKHVSMTHIFASAARAKFDLPTTSPPQPGS